MSEVFLSPPDSRDYTICRTMDVAGIEIPAKYQLEMPQSELQKAGNCVAQANSTRVEYNRADGKQVSVAWLYGNRRETTHKDSGLVVRDAMKTIIKYGNMERDVFETDAEVPYVINLFEQHYPNIYQKAKKEDAQYIRLYTKEDAQRFILKYNTPVMGIAFTRDLSAWGDTGLHCVLICGWKPIGERYEKEPYQFNETLNHDIIFHNSWGKKWKYNGYGTCTFDTFIEMWGIVPMAEKTFPDIKGHWAESAIKEAAEDGIVNGYEDGTFKPDQSITRAELAAIYQRMKAKFEHE